MIKNRRGDRDLSLSFSCMFRRMRCSSFLSQVSSLNFPNYAVLSSSDGESQADCIGNKT